MSEDSSRHSKKPNSIQSSPTALSSESKTNRQVLLENPQRAILFGESRQAAPRNSIRQPPVLPSNPIEASVNSSSNSVEAPKDEFRCRVCAKSMFM